MKFIHDIVIDFEDLVQLDSTTDLLKLDKDYNVENIDDYALFILRYHYLNTIPFNLKKNYFIYIRSEFPYQVARVENKLKELGIEYGIN